MSIHGKCKSQEHTCAGSDACSISNQSVQGGETQKTEGTLILGQTSSLLEFVSFAPEQKLDFIQALAIFIK